MCRGCVVRLCVVLVLCCGVALGDVVLRAVCLCYVVHCTCCIVLRALCGVVCCVLHGVVCCVFLCGVVCVCNTQEYLYITYMSRT